MLLSNLTGEYSDELLLYYQAHEYQDLENTQLKSEA